MLAVLLIKLLFDDENRKNPRTLLFVENEFSIVPLATLSKKIPVLHPFTVILSKIKYSSVFFIETPSVLIAQLLIVKFSIRYGVAILPSPLVACAANCVFPSILIGL